MIFRPAGFTLFLSSIRCGLWILPGLALFFFTIVLSQSANSQTNKTESLKEITDFVKNQLQQSYEFEPHYSEVKIIVNNLDNRLRLPRCSDLWSVKIPSNLSAGRITVPVECNSGHTWQVFVTAEIKLMIEVVVAKHSIRRGEILMDNDLIDTVMDMSNLRQGYLIDKKDAVGYELKRNVALGEPLRHQILAMPMVISRGEMVSISAVSSAMSVEASGTALSNGRVGDLIRVRNNRSGRIVQAKVKAPGKVEITL